MEKKITKWQWKKDSIGNTITRNGNCYSYSFDESKNIGEITSEDTFGNSKRLWHHKVLTEFSAFIIIEKSILYAGLYPKGSTGCEVIALNLSTSDTIWKKPLLGLGSVGHSRYSNSVQLLMIDERLVIFGSESAGKYIEILDPKNGNLISNRKI